MRLSTFLLALTATTTTTVTGWTIPSTLADGIYTIEFPFPSNSSSNSNSSSPLIKRHSSPPSIPNDGVDATHPNTGGTPPPRSKSDPKTAELSTLPFPVSKHDCRFNRPPLLQRDYAAARASLFAYCEDYLVPVRTRHIGLAKQGAAVAYICNLDWNAARGCSREEMESVEERYLDMRCGDLQPGWAESGKVMKRYGRGYANDLICGEGNYMHASSWEGEEMPEIPYGGD